MLEIGSAIPRASLEVSMAEGLGERTRRDDLRFVQIDSEPNAAEALGQSGEEAADGRGGACAEAVVEEEGADINASRVQGFRGCAGLCNGWVNSQSKEHRTEGASLPTATTLARTLMLDPLASQSHTE